MNILEKLILICLLNTMIYSFQIGKLIPFKPNDYDNNYYPKALLATIDLRKDISLITKEFNHNNIKAWCYVSEPKEKKSLLTKIYFHSPPIKTQSGIIVKDFENIKDLIRGTIVIRDLKDAELVINLLKSKYGEPIKLLNRFENPSSDHFRFFNLVFQYKNKYYINRDKNLFENKDLDEKYYMKFELQIQLCDIMLIKSNIHLLYDITRFISQINEENTYEKILDMTLTKKKDYEKVFEKVNEKIRAYIPNEFIFYDKAFEAWNSDKNNKEKISLFLNEIKRISIKINDAVYENYLERKKLNNSSCNLDHYFDNSNCIKKGNDRILDAGGKFIHQLLE